MARSWHGTLAVVIVILFGCVLFYTGTDGFHAFTAERARAYELTRNKPAFPAVTLQDSEGQTFTFDDFAKGKYVFLSFMYTSCVTVCPTLEMDMAEVYRSIPHPYLGKDIVFLSISFDPARDDPERLHKYSAYFGSDGKTWRMARVENQAELKLLLKTLGVVVVPDGKGNFTHNAAFYLIGKEGRLLDVMDFTKIKGAANTVMTYLNGAGEQ